MPSEYNGLEDRVYFIEDYDDLNVWNIQEKWLEELREEYDYYKKTPVDVRIYNILEQIKMMVDSKGAWVIHLQKDLSPDSEEGSDDGMVGC
tara:strand:+ start:322 stop:594 length:273 start_codon:yes stop_codon:yes gene_type:complete